MWPCINWGVRMTNPIFPKLFSSIANDHSVVVDTHHNAVLYEIYRRIVPKHTFQEYERYRNSFKNMDECFLDLLDRIEARESIAPPFEQMTLFDLATSAVNVNQKNGWYDGSQEEPSLVEKVSMIIVELSEAIGEIQKGRKSYEEYFVYPNGEWGYESETEIDGVTVRGAPSGFGTELADALLRLLSLARKAEIPIERLAVNKLEYNATRGYRHGGRIL